MPVNRKGYLKEFRQSAKERGLCAVCCKPNDKPTGLCRSCTDKRNAYYRTDEGRAKKREHRRRYRLKQWVKVLSNYGAFCRCCSEDNPMFLTLDHVNNDGHLERKGRSEASHKRTAKAIRERFPDSLQVLCFNCNLGKSRNGGTCPHKTAEITPSL